jgi:hypothetical protein
MRRLRRNRMHMHGIGVAFVGAYFWWRDYRIRSVVVPPLFFDFLNFHLFWRHYFLVASFEF